MHAWCDVLASVLVSMLMPLRVKASLSKQMNKVFCISNQTAISTVNPTTRLCSFFPSPFSHRSTCGPFRLMANQLKWQSTFANSNKTPFVRIEFVIKKIPIYHHVQLYITHTHTDRNAMEWDRNGVLNLLLLLLFHFYSICCRPLVDLSTKTTHRYTIYRTIRSEIWIRIICRCFIHVWAHVQVHTYRLH